VRALCLWRRQLRALRVAAHEENDSTREVLDGKIEKEVSDVLLVHRGKVS